MDPFDLLNVTVDSTDAEVRKAFREQSLRVHPDKRPPNERQEASVEFDTLKKCYSSIATQKDRQALWNMLNKTKQKSSNLSSSEKSSINSSVLSIRKEVEIELEQVFLGTQMPIDIEFFSTENGIQSSYQSCVYVDIPKGSDTGEVLTCHHDAFGQSFRVDVRVKIKPHSLFKRRGLDLIYVHTVSLREAICGFNCHIDHLSGRKINVNCYGKIVTPETVERIQGMGLTRGDKIGSLIIEFNIRFPKTLSNEVKKQIAQLI